MKRRYQEGSSAVALSTERGSRRILMAGFAIIAALILVLTIAVRPMAFADENQANSAPSNTQSPTKALTLGQIGSGSATVLVYLNGSDLESQAGEATSDIAEMLESGIGANANVVIETLGTSEWQDYGIASDHTQRYIVNQGNLELVDDSLGQLDTTDPDTLADFISWGVENYPADRYILLLWDHGAGPVYGFGYDEFQSEESAMTLDEMKQALEANSNVHFDFIGMDCCIMGSIETCLVLQPYCDYMIVSEDFEPGIGWSYERWMSMLEQDPSVDTVELGKVIVDDMVADAAEDEEYGDATLALVDESRIGELYNAWVSFAYANEDTLLGTNYSQETEWRDRPESGMSSETRAHSQESILDWLFEDDDCTACNDGSACESCNDCSDCYGSNDDDFWDSLWEDWDFDGSYVTMTDYFVTDIMQVASSIKSDEAATLKSAFENAMVYYNATSGEEGMSGLGVTLPYADGEFYDELVKVFKASGIDSDYVNWLEAFVDAEGADNYYTGSSSYGYDDFSGADVFGDGGHQGHGTFGDDRYDYGYGYGSDNGYDYGYGSGNGYGSDNGYGFGYEEEHTFGDGGHGSSHGKPEWSDSNYAETGHHRFV